VPKALTKTPEQRELVRKRRQDEIKALMTRQVHIDLRLVGLARHALKDEEELDQAGLTAREKRVVRAWELPRREIPFALQSAHERVTALVRREGQDPKVTLNVERAVIKLPDSGDDEDAPVVIDAQVVK
jgi:hypothetical protein